MIKNNFHIGQDVIIIQHQKVMLATIVAIEAEDEFFNSLNYKVLIHSTFVEPEQIVKENVLISLFEGQKVNTALKSILNNQKVA